MSTPARTPVCATADPAAISSLRQRFGGRWTIVFEPVPAVWSAEIRSPSGLRYICDPDPARLAAKLAAAEAGH